GLAAKGHRVVVLATAMPERLRVNGVRFEAIDVPTSPVFDHAPYGLAVANKLVELVRRGNGIDLVHLHYAVPHASSALLAATVLGAAAPAMIVTLHGTDVTRLGGLPSVHAVTAYALAACDGLTTPSRFLRDEAAERFAIAADRIAVISNFVDVARFSPPPARDRSRLAALFPDGPDGPMLFHVSNFRPIKRTRELADILAGVRTAVPARMILVGDGPDHAAAIARAAELGLTDHMRFLGRRDDFETLLGHADGFVLPSDSESFGVAALEAMACGVPVFGYDVGGVPDVVGDTGTLVPRGDTAGLARAIVAGMPRSVELGRAARVRAESRFGSERVVAAYEDYFRRVLATRTKEDS
ncbi:MAG TPA: N-acetyl-alpha-D-glucosaminyl L-malate synthase BshA, partial [Kofleriaceae bacterium]|nr:N-acetyl-alpha-D-glucosaminyl L-malate synthase BshA [Kofleriaceae bacterium]